MTRFKICGLRQLDHALAAASAGADFLGFNFVPGVRRQVTEEHARTVIQELRRLLGERCPRVVGLFANQPVEDVNRVIRYCGLDFAQLCGDEPPDYWGRIEASVVRQVKVADVGPEKAAIDDVLRRVEQVVAGGHLALLDRHEAGRLGGTGRAFNWSIAAAVAEQFDIVLAGGLTPDNVAQAIATVRPWGVDVSSGVETNGVKDPAKIIAFAEKVRLASPHHQGPAGAASC